MKQKSIWTIWFLQIRGPFLVLSIVLVLIGVAAANFDGHRHPLHTLLLFVGLTMAHISVNLFNELLDHLSGIDARTERTPFSGGSGQLQGGSTTPRQVRIVAYGAMVIAAMIGTYFIFTRGLIILLFMVIGAFSIRFYSNFLARWILGELMAGLCMGSLPVIGSYTVITGTLPPGILLVSITPGILTALLLLLNEFPDAQADRYGGRRHLVIVLGKRRSARIYGIGLTAVYLSILIACMLRTVPFTLCIALLTLPLAIRSARIVLKDPDDMEAMGPALGLNVAIVLLTDLLLAVGYWIA